MEQFSSRLYYVGNRTEKNGAVREGFFPLQEAVYIRTGSG